MLSSFFSGISGLMTNSHSINVVGNNIANVNTVGFKSSRATFEDVLYQSVFGSAGSSQIGRGSALSSVDTLFAQGSFESTSVPTDLAIGGKGFFIVKSGDNGTNYFTRAGEFRFDKEGNLTNPAGLVLQGKAINRTTHTAEGVDTDVIVSPEPSEPRATQLIAMKTNLQSNSAWAGNVGVLSNIAAGAASNVAVSEGKIPRAGDYSVNFVAATNTLTVSVQTKNPDGTNGAVRNWSSVVAAGQTYSNFGGSTTAPLNVGSGLDITVGAALPVADQAQAITLQGFSVDNVSTTRNPTTTSNYSSSVTAYDSLGQPHVVTVYYRKAYEDVGPQTSTWEWMAHLDGADAATGTNTLAGWGTLTFNANGTLTAGGNPPTLTFDFSQGATPQQAIDIVLGSGNGPGTTTQYPIAATTNFQTQDGYAPGTLSNVTVSADGVISGHYSNGQILDLYQITLANFNNPQALSREGGNLFAETLESGVMYPAAPGEGGLGKISPNSLEQSNVDLATEFVKMIVAQRGFQANSRVITTTDEILQELMNIKR